MLLMFAFVAVPVMAHEDDGTNHPLNEDTEPFDEDGNGTIGQDEGVIEAHNDHPVPEISTDDDTTTVDDDVDGNKIKIVYIDTNDDTTDDDETVTSRTFTLLVDFGQDVVQSATLEEVPELVTDTTQEATPPTLGFTTIVVNKDGREIGTSTDGTSDSLTITVARKAESSSEFIVTIVVAEAALPDGMDADDNDDMTDETNPALDEITIRIRVNATGVTTDPSTVYSLATLPGFTQVPGGASMMSNLLELTLVGDLGTDPISDPALQSVTATAVDADGIATFTFTFDKANPDFTLGDIEVGNGIPTDLSPNADKTVWTLTATQIDAAVAVTAESGTMNASSDAPDADPDPTGVVQINVNPPTAPNTDGELVFTITSSLALSQKLTINDFDIDTAEAEPLASGDLVEDEGTLPDGIAERYMLTVTPKSGVRSVLVELRAGTTTYQFVPADGTSPTTQPTPGAEGRYDPETEKPTIAISIPANSTYIDSISGGTITLTASDNERLKSGSEIVEGEVTVEGGSIMSDSFTKGATASFTLIPEIGKMTVKVTVKVDAVEDHAGNKNIKTEKEFNVGPIFEIPANTILVITKSGVGSATYDYLSDQPRLPINEDPPLPAPDITVRQWENMPDLEVLFNLYSRGGTVSMKKHPTSGDFDTGKVRISEVMWAADLSIRGGTTDDPEAAEQWIEIENYDGKPAKVFLYARTAQDSANTHSSDGHFDRVGNAYNGSPGSEDWQVPGNSGNSYTGLDNFVSMWRRYVENNRAKGYANGTSSGAWSASDREYLRRPSGAENTDNEYMHIGSPGRLHSYNFTNPPIKSATTVIPGSLVGENEKVLINEVGNHSDVRYQWIELRNYGSQVADLRNFRITKVTAVGTDDELINFAHNDGARIPVGGVLLLVATDPRFDDGHPIAVGYNVDKPNADQVAGLGLNVADSPRSPARYDVVNFKNGGLPDNGEFVLIVRSPDATEPHANKNEGGKGWAERGETDLNQITDIAGYHPNLAKDNYPARTPVLNNTKLWPLINFGPPNLDHNKLEVDRVHHRQKDNTPKPNANSRGIGWDHDDRAAGRAAFANSGYSGIGYKRTARNLIVHNGTPGYHNNTVNNKANSSVRISELMYSTGANGQLPQWIELYNSSATKAVHLGSGWHIRIETLDGSGNALSGLLTIHFGSKGKVKYIYPQQTVLIAAGNARQAGSDFQAASVVFPENRLFNVSREYSGDGALKSDGFANDRYMFFNPKAFHLALLDKDGALVDSIGNLDGDSRTNDTVTPDEEFPSAVSENGMRTSIIRIYDDGDARTGSNIVPVTVIGEGMRTDHDGIDPKYAWIPAVNTGTEFKITIRSTWYGHEDDYGTPGHRRGLVLPVQLSSFRPTLEDGVVTVRWTTESELDNAGFNIYRSETRDGEYKQVNTELIDGAGTTGERSNYSWVDQTAKPGVVYYYQIEDVSFAGDREALAVTKLKGLISAKNKLTTTWSELKEASQ